MVINKIVMTRSVRAIMLLLIVFSLLLSGCAESNKQKILGLWHTPGLIPVEIEFTSAGKIIINTGLFASSGTYEFLDEDTIMLSADNDIVNLIGLPIATPLDISIQGSELSLWSGGIGLNFQRGPK